MTTLKQLHISYAYEQRRCSELLLKKQQLQNDLDAAKTRETMHRADELKLAEEINRLRRDKQLTDGVIDSLTRDRNDWRDAFKLIMKLVK